MEYDDLNSVVYSDCNYYDMDPDYDYYNIAQRATRNLQKPHYVIALILVVLAIIANILSLAAVFKVRQVWTSHFRLLVSLMLSDLLVDFSFIFHIINKVTNPGVSVGTGTAEERLKSRCAFVIVKALNTTALNVTLLNLVGLGLDHYWAITKPLHHSILLGKRKTMLLIVSFWIISFAAGFSDLLSPLWNYNGYMSSKLNYCEYTWTSPYQEEYTMFCIALLCFITLIYMYIKIYQEVKSRIQQQDMVRMKRNRKALLTTLLILGSFVICWLPTCIFQIVLTIIAHVKVQLLQNIYQCLLFVDKYFYDLLILNTFCDPIIYVLRINEVQLGYKLLLFRCWPSRLHREFSFSRSSTQSSRIMRTDFRLHSQSSYQYDRCDGDPAIIDISHLHAQPNHSLV